MTKIEDEVRAHYEAYPYPPLGPAGPSTGSRPLEDLRAVLHHGWRGRAKQRPLRILVAGGGTGSAAVQFGLQLPSMGGGEIVYVDLSEASRQIAIERARRAGLGAEIQFIRGSLLDLPQMGLGCFDYIACTGVLHHLPDPDAGARVLAGALADDGCIGIMLYGELGRTGVYPAQTMLRMLGAHQPDSQSVELARHLLRQLPPSNWLVQNREQRYDDSLTDAEVYDRFLHSCDRPYTVPACVQMAERAGLRIVDFVPALLFNPALHVQDADLLGRIAKLSKLERYAFTELFIGTLSKLQFFAVKAAARDAGEATPADPEVIPRFVVGSGPMVADLIRAEHRIGITLDGTNIQIPMTLSPLADQILRRIDGHSTLGEIRMAIAAAEGRDVSSEDLLREFQSFYFILKEAATLFLYYRSP